jgi:hypothetical protein
VPVSIIEHSGNDESEDSEQRGAAQKLVVAIQCGPTPSSQVSDQDGDEYDRSPHRRQPELSRQLDNIIVEMTMVSRNWIRR